MRGRKRAIRRRNGGKNVPRWDRTTNLQLRRLLLYPIELWARNGAARFPAPYADLAALGRRPGVCQAVDLTIPAGPNPQFFNALSPRSVLSISVRICNYLNIRNILP